MSALDSVARTGLKAAMTDLQVTGHNVANASTVGFKQSAVRFADLYASNQVAGKQVGIGAQVAGIDQDFSEGTNQITGRNMDLSISGQGFFAIRNITSQLTTYTRAGQFQLDKSGYITQNGNRLQGFEAFNNNITTNLIDLQIPIDPLPAAATTTVGLEINLDATSTVPANPFNSSDPTTYNHRTDNVLYDSLGTPSNLSLFYVKTAANTWNVEMEVDGTNIGNGTLTFNSDGTLNTATGFTGITWNPTTGATSPQAFDVAFTNSTQFSNPNETRNITQDGYTAGVPTSFDFDRDGMLTVRYSNAQAQLIGQVAVARFPSPTGLANVGGTSWVETSDSGAVIMNAANSKNVVNPGSLELSNVDLSAQLINLINAQNYFQANAQVVKTSNELNQTVINIR